MKQVFLGLVYLLLLGNQAYAEFNIGKIVQGLDPGRISWWRSKWSSLPLELSKINQSTAGVEISVRWTPSTDIEYGILELELPSAFTLSSGTVLTHNIKNIIAGEDYITHLDQTVTNPTAGVYGPVKIRTRYTFPDGQVGQIADANESFAMLYIAGTESKASTNLVIAIDEATPRVGEVAKTLNIQFNLAYDIWKYDLVKLTLDSSFSLSSTVKCTSYKEAPNVNYLTGTNSDNSAEVACASSVFGTAGVSDILYIYGLDRDIEISNDSVSAVEIRVSSINMPDRKYSSFSWNLEILDHSNRWVIQSGTYTAGPVYDEGLITTASWTPTWNSLSKDKILPNMSLYVDVSVTTVNVIPSGGVIEVILSDFTDKSKYLGNTTKGCFMTNNLGSLDCTVDATDSKKIIISGFEDAASNQFNFTTVVTFDADSVFSITSVTSKALLGGLNIDTAINLAGSAIGQVTKYNHLELFEMSMVYWDGTAWAARNTAGNPNDQTMYFFWKIGTLGANNYIKDGVNFKLSLPFTNSVGVPSQDKSFYYKQDTGLKAYYVGHENPPTFAGDVDNTDYKSVSPVYTPGDRNTGNLSFKFDSLFATYTTNQATQLTTVYFTLHRITADPMANPLVASNAETRYQTILEVSDTNVTPGFNTYYGAYQYEILPAAWHTDADFLPFTLDNIAGLPAKFVALPASDQNPFPPTATAVAGRTYYIEVELDNYGTDRMSSGLENGDEFPCKNDSGAPDVSCTIWQVDSSVYIRASGIPQITSIAVTWFTTIGAAIVSGTSVNPTLRAFYMENDDKRGVKYITYEEVGTVYTPITPTSPGTLAIAGLPIVGGLTASGTTVATHALTGTAGIDMIVFIAPEGFSFEGTPGIVLSDSATNTDAATTGTQVFSSPNMNWATIFAVETDDGTAINGQLDTLSTKDLAKINGLRLPEWTTAGYTFWAIANAYSFDGSAAANTVSTLTGQTLGLGTLEGVDVIPKTVLGRGLGSAKVDMTVSFKATHKIPEGGSIQIEINTNKWRYVEDSVNLPNTYTGLTVAQEATQIDFRYSSGIYTTTAFSEIAGGACISVTLPALIPAEYIDASSIDFLVSITTFQDSQSANSIDKVLGADITEDNITITQNSATGGKSTLSTMKTLPMNAGLPSAVDLYLEFSFNYAIPARGYFIISLSTLIWQYTDRNLYKYCWLSGNQYAACEMTAEGVKVTLAKDYTANQILEMYLESAIKNPATVTPIVSAISFCAYYGSMTIFTDTTAASFTAHAAAGLISESEITADPKNIGEAADYRISFKSESAISESDEIWIVFPEEYDYFTGDAKMMFAQEERTYYIGCASQTLGKIWCTVDHRIVVVTAKTTLDAGIAVDIELYGIINPVMSTDTDTASFKVYHYDPINETAKAALQTFGTLALSAAVSSNILIKSVEITDETLYQSSDIKLTFYVSEIFEETDWIIVEFPNQWQLDQSTSSSISCSTTIQNDSDLVTDNHTEVDWIKSANCASASNMVYLDMPAGESKTIAADHIVRWTLNAVKNPEYALDRSVEEVTDWKFELTDSNIFTQYDYWTNKFNIIIYNEATQTISSRSHFETHDAYLGFYDAGRSLYVNKYSPEKKENRIIVYAGTQTQDIYISTESASKPNASHLIQFLPTLMSYFPSSGNEDKLNLTSTDDNWILHENQHQISFRVSADISLAKGLYYIDWNKTEERQEGVTQDIYQNPVKTLVEVVGKVKSMYEFSVRDLYTQFVGGTSIPIEVSVSNPPHSDVAIKIKLAESVQATKVTVSPSVLTFGPDVHTRYFTISVASNYDLATSTSELVTFTLSGTDAYAYDISESQTLLISQGISLAGSILSIEVVSVSKTKAVLKPVASQRGIVYLQVSAKGSYELPIEELIDKVGSFTDTESETTEERMNEIDHYMLNNSQEEGELWTDYKNRLYRTHLMDDYYTAVLADEDGSVENVELAWLWAATDYQVSAYLVSGSLYSEKFPQVFTTEALHSSVRFSMNFEGNISEERNVVIKQQAARVIGVDPQRVVFSYRQPNNPRRLQTDTVVVSTDFVYFLLNERNSETPSPKESVELLIQQQGEYKANLRDAGISNELADITDPEELTAGIPKWNSAPISSDVSENSITIEMSAAIAGFVACIADPSGGSKPSARQVYSGVNILNTEVSNAMVAVDNTLALTTLEISGLKSDTAYDVWCIVTDDIPIWPTLMADSDSTPTGFSAITYKLEDDKEDCDTGTYITTVFLLLTVLLLN